LSSSDSSNEDLSPTEAVLCFIRALITLYAGSGGACAHRDAVLPTEWFALLRRRLHASVTQQARA
jgi:hypothetical protein